MKREIKFRAWDKEEKILCSVRNINLDLGCFLVGNSPTPERVDEKIIVDYQIITIFAELINK